MISCYGVVPYEGRNSGSRLGPPLGLSSVNNHKGLPNYAFNGIIKQVTLLCSCLLTERTACLTTDEANQIILPDMSDSTPQSRPAKAMSSRLMTMKVILSFYALTAIQRCIGSDLYSSCNVQQLQRHHPRLNCSPYTKNYPLPNAKKPPMPSLQLCRLQNFKL